MFPGRILLVGTLTCVTFSTLAQLDPEHRNLLQLGYDQPLIGQGPQAVYAYYYYNNPDFHSSNAVLRLAIAPAYADGELGFKHVLSENTDMGIGIYGGLLGDNYYEVRQGTYFKGESFQGDGGGMSVSLYQLLDPGRLIPLNFLARGGFRYSTFYRDSETYPNFTTPSDFTTTYVRTGLRFAGKEPVLYPDLGLEISVWYERQWRIHNEPFGFHDERNINADTDLYWAYAGLNYAFTNIGHQFSIAITAGGSVDADRFSAWRLGGVLPLVSEFPLVLPGYYYEELTARSFLHFYGSYVIALDPSHRFQFRFESAAARIEYLPGFEQPQSWEFGAGGGLSYTPKSQLCRIILRYGYGFNAIRDGKRGAQSIGILFQYDFQAHKKNKPSAEH
jgi:hypothetical protein